VDVQRYRENRQKMREQEPKFRELCMVCMQPKFSCFCQHVQRVNAKIDFVILIHPVEAKRRIATGRMSHLCLENSRLIMGQDYSHNKEVNEILADSSRFPVILYPKGKTTNVSPLSQEQRAVLFPMDKKLTIFVIDGTWATAIKTVRQSQNLQNVPRICFSPEKPSTFRVRKQPAENCFSTIEAIHQIIELVGPSQGFDVRSRDHDKLLYVFDKMVELQLEFIRISESKPGTLRYRRDRRKSA